MINGRTRLHVVANGTMTGQRYIDEVLLPHVRLFRGAVGDKFVFMDDNATCHRTLAVQDCLDSEGQVAGRNYPPTNKNTLIRALTEEWDKLPQELLDNVVQTNRPQCNGKNERVNQTLVAKLRCKVNSTTKTPWTKLLEQVTYEYNNSPHDVTGFPPAYLMFGTLPYDSPLPNQVKLNYPPIQQARQIAVNRTIKHHKINKQRYDKHYVDAKFKVGDLVLYQNFSYPNSSKLQSPYNGPFKVVRKLSNVTYEIDKPNQYTGKLTDIVHSTRLKPFHSKSNFQLC
ncbi:transposon Ty3-G Gag-Pol polyprotein [Trichonephila clavipes]|nr:transposon Ty3-G Gag-Pol polyprotein [Trichonephila clavipes]